LKGSSLSEEAEVNAVVHLTKTYAPRMPERAREKST